MRYTIFVLIVMTLLFDMTISDSSAIAKDFRTEGAKVADVTGTFTLVLYGGRYFKDVETIAFLDVEGDQYTFEPYAPEFDYRVIKGLSAKEALNRAEQFVSSQYAFWRSQLSRIIDDKGNTVGYEVRPYYRPLAFGLDDVMDISYSPKGNNIRIHIRLKSQVERQLFGDGSRERDH